MPTPARRVGRRERCLRKDNKILGAYGQDTLNDNGELLLSFANNHDLELVTRSSAHARAAYYILSTGEAKNVSTTS